MSSKLVESGEQIKMATRSILSLGTLTACVAYIPLARALNSLVEHTRRKLFAKPARIGVGS